jgi:hypothetical protein
MSAAVPPTTTSRFGAVKSYAQQAGNAILSKAGDAGSAISKAAKEPWLGYGITIYLAAACVGVPLIVSSSMAIAAYRSTPAALQTKEATNLYYGQCVLCALGVAMVVFAIVVMCLRARGGIKLKAYVVGRD